MKKTIQKIASVLLASCLVTGLLGITALADGNGAAGSRTLSIADQVAGTAEVEKDDTVTMNVTVSGGGFATMTAEVLYDANLFAYKSCASTVFSGDTWIVSQSEGVVKMMGTTASDQSEGSTAATLTFTAKDPGETAQTGSFTITGGAISLEDQASYDLVTAAGAGDTVTVKGKEETPSDTVRVTLGSGLTGLDTATKGKDYTGQIEGYDSAAYRYVVSVNGDAAIAVVNADGSFTVPGSSITGDLEISVTVTAIAPPTPPTPPAPPVVDDPDAPDRPGEDIGDEDVPKDDKPDLPDNPDDPDGPDEDIEDEDVPKDDKPDLPDNPDGPGGSDEDIEDEDVPKDDQPDLPGEADGENDGDDVPQDILPGNQDDGTAPASQPAGEIGRTEDNDVPRTGDNSHITLWTLLSAFSAGGLAVLCIAGRKRGEKE